MSQKPTTSNGKKGGYLKGKSHAQGGIKGIVTDTDQLVELEGGEVIINKAASKLHCEELSRINQSAGGGVAIPCDKSEVKEIFRNGGQLQLFDTGGEITPAIIDALKIQLKYSQSQAEIDNINSQIEIYKDHSLTPKEIKDKIAFEIKKLQALFSVNDILDKSDQSLKAQQNSLLNWIKAKDNKVKVLIAFSGGKDSVAMVIKALFIDKIPKDQIELHHHKVDGGSDNYIWDWPCTDSYCKAFAKHFGLKIFFSYSGGGITKEIFKVNSQRQPMYWQEKPNGPYISRPPAPHSELKTKLKFPAVANSLDTRWCSSVAKIEVMSAILTNSTHFVQNANVVVMTGERRLESTNRSKYNEIEVMKQTAPTKNRKCIVWRNVIEYTEDHIWEMFKEHKIQPHPCYMLGWSRCSCQLCIFNDKDTWASANEISPERVKAIADIETDLKKLGSPLPYLYAKKATKAETLGIDAYMKDVWKMIYPNDNRPKWVTDVRNARIAGHDKRSIEYDYYDTGFIKAVEKPAWRSGQTDFNTQVKAKKAVKLINSIPKDVKINEAGYVANGIYADRVNIGKSFITAENKKRWSKEANSIFTSPIITNEWQQPIGANSIRNCGAD